jgi:hypothetical protein
VPNKEGNYSPYHKGAGFFAAVRRNQLTKRFKFITGLHVTSNVLRGWADKTIPLYVFEWGMAVRSIANHTQVLTFIQPQPTMTESLNDKSGASSQEHIKRVAVKLAQAHPAWAATDEDIWESWADSILARHKDEASIQLAIRALNPPPHLAQFFGPKATISELRLEAQARGAAVATAVLDDAADELTALLAFAEDLQERNAENARETANVASRAADLASHMSLLKTRIEVLLESNKRNTRMLHASEVAAGHEALPLRQPGAHVFAPSVSETGGATGMDALCDDEQRVLAELDAVTGHGNEEPDATAYGDGDEVWVETVADLDDDDHQEPLTGR